MLNPEVTPESRVSQNALTKHWMVDADSPLRKQGFRRYDDALAEAYARQASDLRSWARVYESKARSLARDVDLLPL